MTGERGRLVDLGVLRRDLRAEHDALFTVVAALDEHQWELETASAPWRVSDQIIHLRYFDQVAARVVTDPDGFDATVDRTPEAIDRLLSEHLEPPGQEPSEILTGWRRAHASLQAAVSNADPSTRVPWYGPSMSIASLLTARLMETWAHGVDVRDALGLPLVPTTRLHHVAHLGVATRRHSFWTRGIELPTADVFVQLDGPGGEVWTWGSSSSSDRVVGDALQFCLVVTQRRNVADTDLRMSGVGTQEWMAIAQAFAGPPGPGRPTRTPRSRDGTQP